MPFGIEIAIPGVLVLWHHSHDQKKFVVRRRGRTSKVSENLPELLKICPRFQQAGSCRPGLMIFLVVGVLFLGITLTQVKQTKDYPFLNADLFHMISMLINVSSATAGYVGFGRPVMPLWVNLAGLCMCVIVHRLNLSGFIPALVVLTSTITLTSISPEYFYQMAKQKKEFRRDDRHSRSRFLYGPPQSRFYS